MRLTNERPYAKPEAAAKRLWEIIQKIEPVHGRTHVEKFNGPFLFVDMATPAEYSAGMNILVERGFCQWHESGTFITLLKETDSHFD
ncbi:hypothetical protein [Bradyrhizobium ottawaense]|uniref:Uncharacterized protein n=1 Tax=Bradyrhizobium ottawaense TaxID=931866 RepID=A0ABY0QH86_9BRAD|nr:hypothetical protein [Bradyrhizobium ottawaense]SDK42309.1 hypothetical protein SAMN05444163_8074 [Bradyrhizobium ottawaense]